MSTRNQRRKQGQQAKAWVSLGATAYTRNLQLLGTGGNGQKRLNLRFWQVKDNEAYF